MNVNNGRKLASNSNADNSLPTKEVNNETKNQGEASSGGQIYNIQDLYKIIQVQQSTINKMTLEVCDA